MKSFHFLVAPDSFKESLSAQAATAAISNGLARAFSGLEAQLTITQFPLADGGEGTMTLLANHFAATKNDIETIGPLGESRHSYYFSNPDSHIAIIESAELCGLPLVPPSKRNPLNTTSYGLGVAINHALAAGAKKLFVALGGSATNDCGIGMLTALGARCVNQYGQIISPLTAHDLASISHCDLTPISAKLIGIELIVLCDVQNPLLGPQGASYIFAPQKGATAAMLPLLEHNLHHFSQILEATSQKSFAHKPQTGAAGGIAAALFALGGHLQSGSQFIIEQLQLETLLPDVDYIFTGEGQIDEQTLQGKIISAIVTTAKKFSIPIIVLTGSTQANLQPLYDSGISAIFGITQQPQSLTEALTQSEEALTKAAENVGRLIRTLETKKNS